MTRGMARFDIILADGFQRNKCTATGIENHSRQVPISFREALRFQYLGWMTVTAKIAVDAKHFITEMLNKVQIVRNHHDRDFFVVVQVMEQAIKRKSAADIDA